MTIFKQLRLVCLIVLGLGWTTTLSFGAVVVQRSTIDAVTNGYDMAGAFNQSYDETPRPVWNENQPKMSDEGTFFGSTAQFNAAKGGVDLSLKYKAGWTPAQRAAADAKAAALTKADTAVTPSPVRGGTTQARYRREQGLGSGVDADHTVDLQLGGADDILNMSGLDSSVNRSLGSQINGQIKKLPAGTRVNNVQMRDP